jgi:DNA-binding response OmpR family regulator
MSDRIAFPPELGLTPIEIPLATLLVQRERVSSTSAFAVLYGDRQDKPKSTTVKTHVSHLRTKFARLNLKIETVWGWGWRMPPADREKLRSMISRAPQETRIQQASR